VDHHAASAKQIKRCLTLCGLLNTIKQIQPNTMNLGMNYNNDLVLFYPGLNNEIQHIPEHIVLNQMLDQDSPIPLEIRNQVAKARLNNLIPNGYQQCIIFQGSMCFLSLIKRGTDLTALKLEKFLPGISTLKKNKSCPGKNKKFSTFSI
jgi:hypothetical protein